LIWTLSRLSCWVGQLGNEHSISGHVLGSGGDREIRLSRSLRTANLIARLLLRELRELLLLLVELSGQLELALILHLAGRVKLLRLLEVLETLAGELVELLPALLLERQLLLLEDVLVLVLLHEGVLEGQCGVRLERLDGRLVAGLLGDEEPV
jgi:hypothetical protein